MGRIGAEYATLFAMRWLGGMILVAFLARQNALAVIPVALLVGGISASGGLLQRRFDMPDATTQVLEGLIFICVLASSAFAGRIRWFAR